jgi:D,D-heptose 1,7-bisphosphate phosphatase
MGTPDRWGKVGKDVESGKVKRLNKQNKRPAIFLDRDGVLCNEIDLLCRKEDVSLIPGVAEAVKKINQSEYLAVVVTNQPVIARNLCDFDELRDIHNRLETLLGEQNAYLDAIYFCPHHPDKGYPEERVEFKIECDCRKPKPGMILKAAKDYNIDLANSYMIGDRKSDVLAGENAGVKESFLIEMNKENALLDLINKILR